MEYIFDYSKLRGRIKEKFGSEREYAKAMEMSQQAISNKLNGNTYFTDKEIIKSCMLLDIALEDIPIYFFILKTELNSEN